MSSDTSHRFEKLHAGNYRQWSGNCLALLITKGWFRLVKGKELRPTAADPKAPTAEEVAAMEALDEKAMKAAGEIYLSLSEEQKIHVQDHLEDPVKMWATLESVHLQKKPGMRFNAWEEFLSIRMEANESLSSLMTRIEGAMQKVKNLRPNSFDLDELDKELTCMCMIRALPDSYANFASSLQLLDKFDKESLQSAFVNEEALRSRSTAHGSASVLAANASQATSNAPCAYCDIPGHSQELCFRYKRDKEKARQDIEERKKQRGKNKPKAHATAAAAQELPSESAGQASTLGPLLI